MVPRRDQRAHAERHAANIVEVLRVGEGRHLPFHTLRQRRKVLEPLWQSRQLRAHLTHTPPCLPALRLGEPANLVGQQLCRLEQHASSLAGLQARPSAVGERRRRRRNRHIHVRGLCGRDGGDQRLVERRAHFEHLVTSDYLGAVDVVPVRWLHGEQRVRCLLSSESTVCYRPRAAATLLLEHLTTEDRSRVPGIEPPGVFFFCWPVRHDDILQKPGRPLPCPYLPTYLPTLLMGN